jgi:hypothetical protein
VVTSQSPGLSAFLFVSDSFYAMVYFSVLRMEEINSSVTLVLDTHFYDVVLQEMTVVLHNIGTKYRLLLMGVNISNIING